MHHASRILVALLFVASASAGTFGAGPVTATEFVAPGELASPEPTVGVNWNTDAVFFHSFITTFRVDFDDNGVDANWVDVTPPYQIPINLDPMLHTDEETGRTFAGGLHGPCSVMFYTDDDGGTWLPSLNMCSGAQFDHQSIGTGSKPILGNPLNLPQLQNAYYCGQLIFIGCAVSLDGGVIWTPATPAALTSCAGFHGHWRTSYVTGTAFLPVPDCGSQHGMLVPNLIGVDGTELLGLTGLLFEERLVEGSHEWTGGFDPSIGVSTESGHLYYGMADHMGARMALSHDEGNTWEGIGGGMGVDNTTWLDVGQFHDPPVVKATFADVRAGDDDRVFFSFLGLEDLDGDGKGDEYPDIYGCDVANENRAWNYYVASSYDAGQTWDVVRLNDGAIQLGGVWDGGGGNPCRNLLDFNDMDIDSQGRFIIGFADGCMEECEAKLTSGEPLTPGPYSQVGKIYRQTGGKGLFAEFDVTLPVTEDFDGDGIPDSEDDDIDGDGVLNDDDGDARDPSVGERETKDSPALGAVFILALVGAVLIARKRN